MLIIRIMKREMLMNQFELNLISVIIPVYKAEKHLEKCVLSVLNQLYRNIQIILVDDGSPDGCPQMCDEYAKHDSRIKVIHKINSGTMAACISGLEIATGKYISFIDSDDWIEENMYYHMVNSMIENNADLVQCGFFLDYEKETTEYLGINSTEIFDKIKIRENLVKRLLNFWCNDGLVFAPSRGNKLIKKKLVENNLIYCNNSIKIGEDLNLILPIIFDCEKIVCLNECYYHYNINIMSVTHLYNEDMPNKNIILFNSIDKIFQMKNYNKDLYKNLYFIYMIIYAIYNEDLSTDNIIEKTKKIVKICKENPVKSYLRQYYSEKFDNFNKLILLLMIYKIYFLIPIVFSIRKHMKNMCLGKEKY